MIMNILLSLTGKDYSKKIILLFCAVALFLQTWAVFAAEPRLPFYEAQKGNTRVYILGTMHLGRQDEPLRQDIAQALIRSSKLIQELSDREMAQSGLLMASYFCQDACLRRQLSEKAYRKLAGGSAAAFEAMGGLERMPAWMVLTMLVMMDYEKAGLSPLASTELKLKRIWGGKPVDGLESAEEQMAILATLGEDVQRVMLESHIDTPEEKRLALVRELYAIWQQGDAEALYRWYLHMPKEEGVSSEMVNEIDKKLLVQRNLRFIERLQPYLTSEKQIFVAVGALHLGGAQGVLALLKAQGFTITER
ncbi:MAG: TraB/GumN family protein [Burkholderiales bacterium]|jgi:uncharacterized protein YbaP (TraB family)|nr:TraB/GumN family protein [Burkholderiales bacterium]